MPKRILRNTVLGAFFCLFLLACSHSVAPTANDWKTSTPVAQGLDASILSELSNRIQAGDYGEIHSLLIVRHGYLVTEEYFRICNAECGKASKSFRQIG